MIKRKRPTANFLQSGAYHNEKANEKPTFFRQPAQSFSKMEYFPSFIRWIYVVARMGCC